MYCCCLPTYMEHVDISATEPNGSFHPLPIALEKAPV